MPAESRRRATKVQRDGFKKTCKQNAKLFMVSFGSKRVILPTHAIQINIFTATPEII
jgi:hypothetical protein